MSGATIPYHLRQNKAIDRNIFVDLLSRVGRYRNISDYTYIGFGGAFLEDFKHIHSALRISKMISIEAEENTKLRQEFNKPLSCIKLEHKTSGEFLAEHNFEGPTVAWLDYTSPKELPMQLGETQRLVECLTSGDIFKITFNASPESLGRPSGGEDLQEYRRTKILDRLADYAPPSVKKDDLTSANYPSLLLKAVHSAVKKGIAGDRRFYVQPLSAFLYRDGQPMLTVTAVVLQHGDTAPFFAQTRLNNWKFINQEWVHPTSISVPDLSAKERLFVESLLPNSDTHHIFEKLQYYIGVDPEDATELMNNFVEYYRWFPWFSKVIM